MQKLSYLISFFAIGLGTSLPELSVEFASIRKRNYELLVGDILGSNVVDSTLALGIGPALFPITVSSFDILPLALYTIFASVVVVSLFALRRKIDRKAAIVLIALYLVSYLVFFIS